MAIDSRKNRKEGFIFGNVLFCTVWKLSPQDGNVPHKKNYADDKLSHYTCTCLNNYQCSLQVCFKQFG